MEAGRSYREMSACCEHMWAREGTVDVEFGKGQFDHFSISDRCYAFIFLRVMTRVPPPDFVSLLLVIAIFTPPIFPSEGS